MWTGECWVIGGGPSLTQQFGIPPNIVEEVKAGKLPYSTYDDYLAALHKKNVIGTNVAFMLGTWVSVLYFCDSRFFRTHSEAITAFPNIKVTCSSSFGNEQASKLKDVKRLKRDYKMGLSTKRDTINWNHNSGAAAINFATLAGAKRILLLGFDMCAQETQTHWHSVYGETKTHKNTFRRFLNKFASIAEAAKKQGVEILNVSPNSSITEFRKVALKDVL